MKKGTLLMGLGAFCGIAILILDSRTALGGASEGIRLCIQTVIPSLFPFFVLSILVTGSFVGCSLPVLRPLGRLFRIPKGAESILIAAFLGGYPVGAQTIAVAYRNGQLKKADAERMLSFCNNPGPSFLFGMAGFLFSDRSTPWILWGILVFSALMVSRAFPESQGCAAMQNPTALSPTSVMASSVKIMSSVCGWVIIFRVIIAFLQRWFLWVLPLEAQVALIGLLELSNGCCELVSLDNRALRFLICGCILAFGGFCVTMQTISVTGELSRKQYFLGKGLQTLLTLLLCLTVLYRTWLLPVAMAVLYVLIPGKNEKSCSIPRKAIV